MAEKPRVCSRIIDGVSRTIAATIEAAALLVGRRVRIANTSMYPLLAPGDHVLFDRPLHGARALRRWDLVLVSRPCQQPPRVVKLLAGLPGERVAVARDQLWIDDRAVLFPKPIVGASPGVWQLGRDEYFLLSYAVAVGTDSRHYGPVPRRAILGRAHALYWPPARRRPLTTLADELDSGRLP